MTGSGGQLILVTGVLLIGVIIGWGIFMRFGNIADMCQIKYISEEEMIELERARLEKEIKNPNEKDLFFGEIDKAIELTTRIADGRNNRNTRVIFSISPVFAKGVQSISKEIHQEVIKQLAEEKSKN